MMDKNSLPKELIVLQSPDHNGNTRSYFSPLRPEVWALEPPYTNAGHEPFVHICRNPKDNRMDKGSDEHGIHTRLYFKFDCLPR